MSFLKKVAGAFVEMEEDTSPKAKPQPKRSTPQPVNVAITEVVSYNSGVAISTSNPEFQEFRKKFKEILDEENRRNFPGNDYYEFVVMKNAMSVIPQEDIKYTAAFAGWSQGQSQTKQDLLKTATIYLGLVEKEIKDFNAVYEQEYNQQVVKNEGLIQQKTAKVQQLAEQVNQLNFEIGQLKDENARNTENLKQKHDAFTAAGEAQKEEIQTEIQKINQYIN